MKCYRLAILAVPAMLALVGCARIERQEAYAKSKKNDVFVKGMELGTAKYEAVRVRGGIRLTAWGEAVTPVSKAIVTEFPKHTPRQPAFNFYWTKADACEAAPSNKFITEGWFVLAKDIDYVTVYDREGQHIVPVSATPAAIEVATN